MKKSSRRILSALLAAALAVSVTACGASSSGSTAGTGSAGSASAGTSEDTTVVYAYATDPGTFTPINNAAAGYPAVTVQIYDTLLTYDAQGNLVPGIVTEVEPVDGTHFLLHLRDDVLFSDGHLLTAEDVAYSLKMYAEDAVAFAWAQYVDPEQTKAVDDTTVELVLTEPYAFQLFAFARVNVFYQEAYEASGDGMTKEPVGTGPYTVAEYVPDSYILFEARDDYWAGAPEVKHLKMMFVSESSQKATALMTGEVDFASDLAPLDYESLTQAGYTGHELPMDSHLTIGFNCTDESISSNVAFRKAVAYAMDNEGAVAAAFGGHAEVSNTCGPNGAVDYNDCYIPEDYYTYDLDKAAEYLDEAGVADGTPVRIIYSVGSGDHATVAEILQADLIALGLDATITQVDGAVMNDTMADHGGWDIAIWQMNTAGSCAILDYMTFYPFVIPNLGYQNDEVVALGQEALSSTDEELIAEKTYEVSKIMTEQVPYYSILTIHQLFAYDETLETDWSMNGADVRGTWFSLKE